MKKIDKSTIPFVALGLFVLFETRHMNIGSLANPGAGLFPLLLGIVLLILSLIALLVSSIEKAPAELQDTNVRSVLVVIGVLLSFRLGLPFFGYSLTTFFAFILLLRIVGGQMWFQTIVYSLIFTSVFYFVFAKWLAIQFPKGILPI